MADKKYSGAYSDDSGAGDTFHKGNQTVGFTRDPDDPNFGALPNAGLTFNQLSTLMASSGNNIFQVIPGSDKARSNILGHATGSGATGVDATAKLNLYPSDIITDTTVITLNFTSVNLFGVVNATHTVTVDDGVGGLHTIYSNTIIDDEASIRIPVYSNSLWIVGNSDAANEIGSGAIAGSYPVDLTKDLSFTYRVVHDGNVMRILNFSADVYNPIPVNSIAAQGTSDSLHEAWMSSSYASAQSWPALKGGREITLTSDNILRIMRGNVLTCTNVSDVSFTGAKTAPGTADTVMIMAGWIDPTKVAGLAFTIGDTAQGGDGGIRFSTKEATIAQGTDGLATCTSQSSSFLGVPYRGAIGFLFKDGAVTRVCVDGVAGTDQVVREDTPAVTGDMSTLVAWGDLLYMQDHEVYAIYEYRFPVDGVPENVGATFTDAVKWCGAFMEFGPFP